VELLPPAEHARRFRAAVRARAAELIALGSSPSQARRQADNEFSVYDLVVEDERGWIYLEGLDLPAPSPPQRRRR
jgi:hypothetical protein